GVGGALAEPPRYLALQPHEPPAGRAQAGVHRFLHRHADHPVGQALDVHLDDGMAIVPARPGGARLVVIAGPLPRGLPLRGPLPRGLPLRGPLPRSLISGGPLRAGRLPRIPPPGAGSPPGPPPPPPPPRPLPSPSPTGLL